MDGTIRRLRGYKVRDDGASVSLHLETVEGVNVRLDILPEMIMELVMNLMDIKTEAWAKSEGGVPGEVPPLGDTMREAIDAEKIVQATYPGRDKKLIQVVTKGGGIFEFLLPEDRRDPEK